MPAIAIRWRTRSGVYRRRVVHRQVEQVHCRVELYSTLLNPARNDISGISNFQPSGLDAAPDQRDSCTGSDLVNNSIAIAQPGTPYCE